jgi:hypothetical protein
VLPDAVASRGSSPVSDLGTPAARVPLIESGVVRLVITEPASAPGGADQGAGASLSVAAIEAVDEARLVAENLVLRRWSWFGSHRVMVPDEAGPSGSSGASKSRFRAIALTRRHH